MSDFSLTLGPVAFAGFELPSSITIGGRQRLAIHRLPGGLRIIDALGPDPADIAFSGIFTGPDAADRARLLDTLRVAGATLPLAWDAFTYSVVIENFEADYRSPWWIPYRLTCSVLRDEAAALVTDIVAFAPALTRTSSPPAASPPPHPSPIGQPACHHRRHSRERRRPDQPGNHPRHRSTPTSPPPRSTGLQSASIPPPHNSRPPRPTHRRPRLRRPRRPQLRRWLNS